MYGIAKAKLSWQTCVKAVLTNQTLSITETAEMFQREYLRPTTIVGRLNQNVIGTTHSAIKSRDFFSPVTLVIRRLGNPDIRSVYVGDLVATKAQSDDPDGSSEKTKEEPLVIRRVVAEEGTEIVSTVSEEEPFELPSGHVWLLPDNDELSVKESMDSRTLGPVSYNDIVGRVVYYCKSPVDHGQVDNSTYAMEEDRAIVDCEVDPDELTRRQCEAMTETDALTEAMTET